MDLKSAVDHNSNWVQVLLHRHVEQAFANAGDVDNQLGSTWQTVLDRKEARELGRVRRAQWQALEVTNPINEAVRSHW
jgi:hypothetical protein